MAEMTFYVGMPDAEMHAVLEAGFGVKDCTIMAQVLFNAATSKYPNRVRSHPGDASRPTYLLGGVRAAGPSSPTYLPHLFHSGVSL